jgi:hypothetical protein
MPLYRSTAATPAADNALLGWTYDPSAAVNATALTAGVLYMGRLLIPVACTVTNVLLIITTGGTTLSNSFAALFDSSGNRLGVSADQSTPFQSAGNKTVALSAPVAVAAGYYYGAVLTNGTTPPSVARATSSGAANIGLTSTTFRNYTSGTSQTAVPSSVALGSASGNANAWWFGVS